MKISANVQDFKAGSRAAIGGGVLDNYQYRIQARADGVRSSLGLIWALEGAFRLQDRF